MHACIQDFGVACLTVIHADAERDDQDGMWNFFFFHQTTKPDVFPKIADNTSGHEV